MPYPYPYAEGRALLARGMVHADQGRFDSAHEDLRSSLAIFRDLGAPRDIDRGERALARRRRWTPTTAGSLFRPAPSGRL
jgi:hypothetical protein